MINQTPIKSGKIDFSTYKATSCEDAKSHTCDTANKNKVKTMKRKSGGSK